MNIEEKIKLLEDRKIALSQKLESNLESIKDASFRADDLKAKIHDLKILNNIYQQHDKDIEDYTRELNKTQKAIDKLSDDVENLHQSIRYIEKELPELLKKDRDNKLHQETDELAKLIIELDTDTIKLVAEQFDKIYNKASQIYETFNPAYSTGNSYESSELDKLRKIRNMVINLGDNFNEAQRVNIAKLEHLNYFLLQIDKHISYVKERIPIHSEG